MPTAIAERLDRIGGWRRKALSGETRPRGHPSNRRRVLGVRRRRAPERLEEEEKKVRAHHPSDDGRGEVRDANGRRVGQVERQHRRQGLRVPITNMS